jgi:hypothetical protein
MRTLAPSEKRLLLILCSALFLALNMLGLRAFLQTRTKLRQAIVSSRTELSEDRNWVSLADMLLPADRWISAHPMPSLAIDQASAALLKSERDAAEKAGLKIDEENLIPPQGNPYGSSVSVSAKLSGPFKSLVNFLFTIQSPDAWRRVEKLTLRSDAQPPNVLAEIELRQDFQTASPSRP